MSTDYLIKKYNLHKYHLDIAQILLEQIYSTTVGGKPLIEYGQIEDRTGRNKWQRFFFGAHFRPCRRSGR